MRVAQEEDELAARAISFAFIGLLLLTLPICGWVVLVLDGHERKIRPARRYPERALLRPIEASGIEQETFDLPTPAQAQRTADEQRLSSFGWVDRERGRIRIPIARAIDLYVESAGQPQPEGTP